ncbi:hypothetical protein SCLCIDRAFT_1219387 [Scleroderma citrinum Foug A]|uniref:Uncharacterized protein n=1 Tax=Scleroderma citrinum Foug A TaxID=1036808 RepID=A0A0C3D9Z2_9AGAM|nr:hypothetical protein SCLCIDRAFT_1219387 [Scleroderma citrinum Foug A]
MFDDPSAEYFLPCSVRSLKGKMYADKVRLRLTECAPGRSLTRNTSVMAMDPIVPMS